MQHSRAPIRIASRAPVSCTGPLTLRPQQVKTDIYIQGVSRETDVFEMDVTEQVGGIEAWVGGN